ncbi:MAG: nodulation protein NfeD [Gammaproteobacteria bacterium]|nr:nodulation protein NfeD [Gammaproteobacteria bacterium]MDH3481744.1 nodulation protein NfeD [Gammaproteobacteria bacterium]
MPALLALILMMVGVSHSATAANVVVELEVRDGIGVATSEYLVSGIDHAEEINAELVVIYMDTPGGLMKPMRDIVQKILGSSVPVATYVSPAGARADSAGTYILLASHIAAMTPTSHLGAATPVSLGGEDATPPADDGEQDEDGDAPSPPSGSSMERKVMNDAVAYIRSLAERHGRNADWAEKAVTEAATLTATQALEENVIEFIAADRDELLQLLDGHEVEIAGETRALATKDADVQPYEANWRIKLLGVISNPEIVLLLGLIGIYGLMYEGWNPGAIVPGVVGVICLLLAAYALQVLPVNYAGVALIFLGIALMIAEAYAPSFGALGIGGIAAFVFGSIMMFDSGIPGFGISITFVISIALVFALLIVWMLSYLVKLRRRGAVSGRESIVGGIAIAMEDFSGDGNVWLEGESWHARSKIPISKNQEVIVRAMDGLILDVEPVASSTKTDAQLQT